MLNQMIQEAPMYKVTGEVWEHKDQLKEMSTELHAHILVGRDTEKSILEEQEKHSSVFLREIQQNIEKTQKENANLNLDLNQERVKVKEMQVQIQSQSELIHQVKSRNEILTKNLDDIEQTREIEHTKMNARIIFLAQADAEKARTVEATQAKLDQISNELLALQVTMEKLSEKCPHEASPIIARSVSSSKMNKKSLITLNESLTGMENLNEANKEEILDEFVSQVQLVSKDKEPNQRISTLIKKVSETKALSDAVQKTVPMSVLTRLKQLKVGTDFPGATAIKKVSSPAASDERSPTAAETIIKKR